MCERCKSAEDELNTFLDELENRFPGQEVEGKKVEKNHHVAVAAIVAVTKRYPEELAMILAMTAMSAPPPMPRRGGKSVNDVFDGLFGSIDISEGN